MGLGATLQIGRTALTASQLGIQIAGNNMANAANPHFTRNRLELGAQAGAVGQAGIYVGRGVRVDGLTREVNEAVIQRLRTGISDETAARTRFEVYAAVETQLNELSGSDLSSQLNSFFNSWSERANLVQSSSVVVQQGQQLAGFIRDLRDGLADQRLQIDREVGTAVERADVLLDQIAGINAEIVAAEEGRFTASPLRDQRDALIAELSALFDVSTIEQPSGGVDVLIGSTPVILGGVSRGVTLDREVVDGQIEISIATGDDNTFLPVETGRIGALLETRRDAVNGTIDDLDQLTTQLISEVNRVAAEATGDPGLTSSIGTTPTTAADQLLALSDPTNASIAGLPVTPTNGGFLVQIRDTSTGGSQTVRIDVDLDGIDSTGARGFGDDTSLEDIRAALEAIDGLNATFDASGRLRVEAEPGFAFSFSEDTSGVLGALGMNAFFTGENAGDIEVRADLADSPGLLQTGTIASDGTLIENGAALRIAEIQNLSLTALDNESLTERWQNSVQAVANRTSTARVQAESTAVVRQNLQSQRDGLSGVSLDEESLNLLTFQRQFQGASRLIQVTDELLQTLISIV